MNSFELGRLYLFHVEDLDSAPGSLGADSTALTTVIRDIQFETLSKTCIKFLMDEDNRIWDYFKGLKGHRLRINALTRNGDPYLSYTIKIYKCDIHPVEFSHSGEGVLIGRAVIFNSVCEDNS